MKPLSNIARSLTIAIPFLWLGMVVAISFVETPLKFTAPGVTIKIGVGIGKIVFAALNKLEWVLLVIWLLSILTAGVSRFSLVSLCVVITVLTLQTFWLLPDLTARIEMLQRGIKIPERPLHTYYIIAEISKIGCLLVIGFNSISRIANFTSQPKIPQV